MEDLIQVMDSVFIFMGHIALTHTVHVVPFSSVSGGHGSRVLSTSESYSHGPGLKLWGQLCWEVLVNLSVTPRRCLFSASNERATSSFQFITPESSPQLYKVLSQVLKFPEINSDVNKWKLQLRILLNEFRLRISFVVRRKGERKEVKRGNMSRKKLWRIVHIVLWIYLRVQNLMMATWGPKHVVVNSIPPCYLI
jgi:hypothetical protein